MCGLTISETYSQLVRNKSPHLPCIFHTKSHLQKECTGHAAPLPEVRHRLPNALRIKP